MSAFNPVWRARQSAAFELAANSTARRTVRIELWGRPVSVYANANLSIYSAQACNARCAFCVEELRPASRGIALDRQKTIEADDARYFALDALPANTFLEHAARAHDAALGQPDAVLRIPTGLSGKEQARQGNGE